MHNSTYILVKDSHSMLQEIVNCVNAKNNSSGNLIADWKIIQPISKIQEIDLAVACMACTVDGQHERTCLILHAYRGAKTKNEDEKMPDYIHVTPHFLTTYAMTNYCPNEDLEKLLKCFDTFVKNQFANSFIDIKHYEI